ncbi:MAG: VWA domain-containing protein [Acidobacteria bacterium]|nr:VWA domain-containing protein [Acidobacteriota bacterium]MBV9068454.1 VWA domain-containing protein [Acidobacteriota bacterium]MBV9187392.1 VWA domain-containing protein [Acidobacteriota bacterium]
MNAISFRAPQLLWLALAVPVALIFFIARERQRIRIARRFVSERLRGVANPLRFVRPWLAALALLGCVIALAGPEAGFRVVPIEQRESNRVIAIDVSLSMAAQDVGTSRLDAAKAIAKRIIDAQQGRVGLVVFESAAEVVSPLTSDDDAVEALLDSIQAGEVSNPGSDLSVALMAALRLAGDTAQRGDIVVISDGEDQSTRLDDTVAKLAQRGVPVSTILIGTAAGSTIPRPEGGGDLVDDNGQVVTTYARPEALQKIAAATGGKFYANPFGEHALDSLAASGGTLKQRNIRVPIERYQWPLAFACVAMFLGSLANRGAE